MTPLQKKYTVKALALLPSRKKFAIQRGISVQAISNWIMQGVAAAHVTALEKAIKKQVTKEQLRPDLFQI
jgi:DNA-binding transcriptional regulator YdaS (Cro superfamily)